MPPNTKPTVDRHAWLKPALAEHGHKQKDVAKDWGVDDAVVSRFIKTGEPELTFDRMQSLARLLGGMSLDELSLRLQEGMAPRRAVADQRAAKAAPAPGVTSTGGDDAKAAVEELHRAAHRAIGALGIRGVKLVLEFGNGESS